MPMEGEESGEEEDGGAHLTPGADPAAAEVQGQHRLGGQHGRAVLIGVRQEAAGRAGPGVVLGRQTEGSGCPRRRSQGAPRDGLFGGPTLSMAPVTLFTPCLWPVGCFTLLGPP